MKVSQIYNKMIDKGGMDTVTESQTVFICKIVIFKVCAEKQRSPHV